jgi:hypothetical protein
VVPCATGFALTPEGGRWEDAGDEAAQMLGNIITAVTWASHVGPNWETRFRAWLVRYLETVSRHPSRACSRASMTRKTSRIAQRWANVWMP